MHGIIRNEVIFWGVEVHIYVYTDIGTDCTKLETYLSCEAWCKKFPNADGYSKYNIQRQKFACP
jgi:hypothetical protein